MLLSISQGTKDLLTVITLENVKRRFQDFSAGVFEYLIHCRIKYDLLTLKDGFISKI